MELVAKIAKKVFFEIRLYFLQLYKQGVLFTKFQTLDLVTLSDDDI